jgi:hypothetical protein
MKTLWPIAPLALVVTLFAGFVVSPASSQSPPEPPEATAATDSTLPCTFCRAPLPGTDFCPRCGRFAPAGADSAGRRFWADAPYVLSFPPQENPPDIQSEVTTAGFVGESVRYASGDRYELKQKKDGAAITGRVGGMRGGHETDYTAEMQDTLDDIGRLASRQVTGHVNTDPDTYLYRKLDYVYGADGLLERIGFVTSFYRGSSDWRKSPAAWLRHAMGEIVLRRDGQGALTRIETTVREGRRSLRGEPEYAEPRLRVEVVTRNGDQVTGIAPAQP